MSNKALIKHIKTFSTFEWLVFIKVLENKSDEELKQIEPNQVERVSLQNSNWYSKLLDLALRLANYEKTKVKFDTLPRTHDYRKFISLYLNCANNETKFKVDLDYSWRVALSKYGYEQLKNYAPPVNDLGRLIELYSPKEALFKERFGLTPKEIVFFYSLNNAKHDIYQAFDFANMLRLIKSYDDKITGKKLQKFLNIFSIGIKKYREKAKELGVTKRTIKSIRLIEQYPIIALDNGQYLIPSKYILLGALSYKIFTVLNELQEDSLNFRTKFGQTFENYIRKMTKFLHDKYFYECSEFIKDKGTKKAEFYLLKDDKVLVVEAKLLHIDENIILTKSAVELENKFKDTILKALSQIDSSFKKINAKNKYAIIVIYTHIPLLEDYIKLFEHKTRYNFLDNVKILSVVDYEIMIHNSYEQIIEYFELVDINDKAHIALYFEQQNKFLEKSCLNLISDLKNKIEDLDN